MPTWFAHAILSLGAVFSSTPCPVLAEGRHVQSLDGTWEIVFDPDNTGRETGLHNSAQFAANQGRREIAVPSCWETIEMDYEGVAFYGLAFTVPPSWQGMIVRLQFDAVNYIAEVYVNDHVIGRHEGGYGPFTLRIDDLLNYDKPNFISLRVIGPIVAQDKVIDGIAQNDMPHWRGAITGGIWQSVRLVATGTALVDDVFLEPRLADNTVTSHLTLLNAEHVTRDIGVTLAIRSVDTPSTVVAQQSAKVVLVPGTTEQSWTLAIPGARYWSPDDPHLYLATIQLRDGSTVLDSESVRFGMRELTIRDQRFELNGKPIYIKAAFFEGLYPTQLALPDSAEMARREIQLARECGFNMIRPWRKPPPPMWLDMCDELGMMVVGGMPIECMRRWPSVTPQLPERIEQTVRSAVLRDRNRACIVQWELFNEIHRLELARLKHPTSMLARRLDPTRLILDESGGFAGGASIYLPYQYEPELFNDVHSYPGGILDDTLYDKYLTISRTPDEIAALGLTPGSFTASKTTPNRLSFVSEIGYGSLPDLVDNNRRFADDGNPLTPPYRYHEMLAQSFREVLQENGLDSVYPDLQKFCLDQQALHSLANKRMIEAIRSNDRIGGYCVHALTAGDWVLGAGLLDLFRNPKDSYWGTQEANQPRYLALRVQPRNVYASRGTHITVNGINDLEPLSGTFRVEVKSAEGRLVFEAESDVSMTSRIGRLFTQKLDTTHLSGTYTAHVSLTDPTGAVVARNQLAFDVFSERQLRAPAAEIAVLDPDNSLRPFLKSAGMAYVEFDSRTPKALPVFVSRAIADNPQVKARFEQLQQFVEQGGSAIYLETIQRSAGNPFWSGKMPGSSVLPIQATIEQAKGLWIGVSHIVTDHPVFAGLPSRCMMGQVYENVWSPQTMINLGGQLIVASVSHGWFNGQPDQQNYLGPEPAWCGMDMGVVSLGQGRYVLSCLRVLDNLGADPVADKILFNLIQWSAQQATEFERQSLRAKPPGRATGAVARINPHPGTTRFSSFCLVDSGETD